MKLTLAEISSAMGALGNLGESAAVVSEGIQSDSRVLKKGEIFLCIHGERFDGHNFIMDAVNKGALAIVADRPPFDIMEELEEKGVPVLMVQDSVKALGKLAAYYRMQTKALVVGVTGTAGKTTVKEVLAQVLGIRGKTARNYLNLNNQIGLAQSILTASGDEKFWVMEAGISEAHDMDELGAILRPDLAVIINAGKGHTEGLGDKGVAHYKAKLLSYVERGGLGLVCNDYEDLVAEAKGYSCELRGFSTHTDGGGQYSAEYLGGESVTHGRYKVRFPDKEFEVLAPFRGEYAAENVIAVAAAADLLGLKSQEIIDGFALAKLPEKRANIREYRNWKLIDDCYNSNPLSALRMVDSAIEMAEGGQLLFVMGEMLELGAEAQDAHMDLGLAMGAANPVAVFWVGGEFDVICKGLAEAGWQGKAVHTDSPRNFEKCILPLLNATGAENGGTVLFKGSRGNRMERFVEVFSAIAQEAHNAI